MSHRIGDVVELCPERPQQCDLCGNVAELRPYGPGGACICIACGRKDFTGTCARMGVKLFGMSEDEARSVAKDLGK